MRSFASRSQITQPLLPVIGILLIAANLRAPVTGVAPLLGMIRETTGISGALAGGLTTLPLLAFAAVSPFAAIIGKRYGIERSLFLSLMLIAAGLVVRSLNPVIFLFLGTAILGAGIAVANVLLPSLLKRDYPDKVGELTGAYALTAGLVAAVASASAVPLASLSGMNWRTALGFFVIIPIVAALVWLPQLGSASTSTRRTVEPVSEGRIWHSALAWQVTIFLGLTSLVYYVIVGWLPTILIAAGYSADEAGSLHGVTQLATAVPGLVFGPVIGRLRDQKGLAAGVSLLTGISLLGLWLAPGWAIFWVALFGFSAGAAFILGLAFVSLRAHNPHRAAALSGMAQCVGYSLAAAGPPAAAFVHDRTGGWAAPLIACIVITLLMSAFGYLAGRAEHA